MPFDTLYQISLPLADDRAALYMSGPWRRLPGGGVSVLRGQQLDLGTFFNAFSLSRWRLCTTLSRLQVRLRLSGRFYIELYDINRAKFTPEEAPRSRKVGVLGRFLSKVIKPSTAVKERVFMRTGTDGDFECTLDLADLDCCILGIRLVALSDGAAFFGGEYLGAFDSERDVRLGITICTFRRERYLLPNLDRLRALTDRNPDISVMVVDNGQTLDEVDSPALQVIHNPNFGGSGGFTRGIMEQVRQQRVTHILLMDDDVLMEMSSFDRLYAFLKHLGPEYQSEFFAGSMLILDDPLIQHENTAYLGHSLGHGFNLKLKKYLWLNENLPDRVNKYAAWWFCCVPVDVVKQIGYPLPIFIKCDDVEYSLRNGKDIMSMNGVAVWHESAEDKWNSVTDYYATRNYLMMFHFAKGKGRFSFLMECCMQILKRILRRDGVGMRMLGLALKDLSGGLEGITSIKSDEQFAAIRQFVKDKPFDTTIIYVILSNICRSLIYFLRFGHHDKAYKKFRQEKLHDQYFWRNFLGIGQSE